MRKQNAKRLLILGTLGLLLFIWWDSRDPDQPSSSWPPLGLATESVTRFDIKINPDVLVSETENTYQYWECVNACDPENVNRIHAAVMIVNPSGNSVATFLSEDKGKSWVASGIWNPKDQHFLSDPTLAIGADSTAYLAFMDVERGQPNSGELVFQKWTTESRSWIEHTRYDGYVDRPWLAIDNRTGKAARIFCLGQRPRHDDHEWAEPILLSSMDQLKTIKVVTPHEGRELKGCLPAKPIVLDNGRLFLAYMDRYLKRRIRTWPRPVIYACISDHECAAFEAVAPVNTHWWSESRQSGVNGGWFPSLATDRSQESEGRIFCVWDDGSSFDRNAVFFSMTVDLGETWSQPVLLSEQPLDDSLSFSTTRSTVCVNRDGVVAVAWYDRRGLPASKLVPMDGNENVFDRRTPGWNIRIRLSHDGGATWAPSVQVNSSPSTGNFFVGHTLGLSADKDGSFHVSWIDDRTGKNELWHATATVGGG